MGARTPKTDEEQHIAAHIYNPYGFLLTLMVAFYLQMLDGVPHPPINLRLQVTFKHLTNHSEVTPKISEPGTLLGILSIKIARLGLV